MVEMRMADSLLARVKGPPLTRVEELLWAGEIARVGADRCAQREAIIFDDRAARLSYKDLDRRSDSFAYLLKTPRSLAR